MAQFGRATAAPPRSGAQPTFSSGFGRDDAAREAERHRLIAQHLTSQLQGRPPPLPYAPPPQTAAVQQPPTASFAPSPVSPQPVSNLLQQSGVSSNDTAVPNRASSQQPPPAIASPLHADAAGYGRGSATPQAQQAPVVRTFNAVLNDRFGNRWYEKDVTCSRASDLVAILERRLGLQLKELLYQGAPLTDANFPFVPDELRLEVRTSPDSASPRRRLTLYVEETPRRVQVEAASVQELAERLRESGIVAEKLMYKVRTPAGEDVFEPLQNLDSLSYEHHVRYVGLQRQPSPHDALALPGRGNSAPPSPPPPPTSPGPYQPAPRVQPYRHVSPAASFQPQYGDHNGVDVHGVMVEAGHLLMTALPGADDDEVASATARVTQQFKQSHMCSEGGREMTPGELTDLRSLVDQYLASVAGTVGSGASVFKSVTFGIAGAFPQLEPGDPSRLQLVPPSVTVTGQPVVLLAHAKPDAMIDIRCTLGYVNEESRVVVINLDEFYVNGWITIGKTSATSLFLAFQPDVLRAGVRYHLDLTAFLADQPGQRCGAAQCEFNIYETSEDQFRAGRVSNAPPSGRAPLVQPPPQAAPADYPAPSGPFQDELREFVETKVLPLYQLSSNPRVTRDEFDDIVEDACADYWKLPPHTILDEDHKRGILSRVKQGIVEARD